jgi:hypothetical protein
VASGTPWYRRAVAVYDWSYRLLHGLNRPTARIGPVLSVQRRWLWRPLRLADGTRLRRGAQIGVLHLDNVRTLALHGDGLGPGGIGFEFRRLFLTSLRAIASRAADGGPLAQLQAYSVTTLFHQRLPILGFAPAAGDRSIWRHLVSLYERALLSSLHPAGLARLRRGARREAYRLWISRETLLAKFGMTPEAQECHREKRSVVAEPSGVE